MSALKTTQAALIVDDEADIRELLELTLARMGLETDAVATLAEARQALAQTAYDLCLTDMRLPDGNGLALVRELDEQTSGPPVAMITAHGDMDSAVETLKAGAFDFVAKPIAVDKLRALVEHALKVEPAPPRAATDAANRGQRPRLIGDSPPMARLHQTLDKIRRSQAPIYIGGESGTGKELVARRIHADSTRGEAAFVPVNCGAIPAELIESELFGYVAGAFTGANHDTPGLFAGADGGTLFLDEVAELAPATQVKLLRALQERAVRPVGSNAERPVDIRVISATQKRLADEVTAGRFRQDLYYRLNVIELTVPALRDRPQDLPALVDNVLARLQSPGTAIPVLDAGAWQHLRRYHFPGNVRELENVLERALTLAEPGTGVITADDLALETAMAPRADLASSAVDGPPSEALASGGWEPRATDLESELEALERQRIEQALKACRYNKTRAAEQLGISFRALRYRLAKLGLE